MQKSFFKLKKQMKIQLRKIYPMIKLNKGIKGLKNSKTLLT